MAYICSPKYKCRFIKHVITTPLKIFIFLKYKHIHIKDREFLHLNDIRVTVSEFPADRPSRSHESLGSRAAAGVAFHRCLVRMARDVSMLTIPFELPKLSVFIKAGQLKSISDAFYSCPQMLLSHPRKHPVKGEGSPLSHLRPYCKRASQKDEGKFGIV